MSKIKVIVILGSAEQSSLSLFCRKLSYDGTDKKKIPLSFPWDVIKLPDLTSTVEQLKRQCIDGMDEQLPHITFWL